MHETIALYFSLLLALQAPPANERSNAFIDKNVESTEGVHRNCTTSIIDVTLEYAKFDSKWTPDESKVRDFVQSEYVRQYLEIVQGSHNLAGGVSCVLGPIRLAEVDNGSILNVSFELNLTYQPPLHPPSLVEESLFKKLITYQLLEWLGVEEREWAARENTPRIHVDSSQTRLIDGIWENTVRIESRNSTLVRRESPIESSGSCSKPGGAGALTRCLLVVECTHLPGLIVRNWDLGSRPSNYAIGQVEVRLINNSRITRVLRSEFFSLAPSQADQKPSTSAPNSDLP